MQEPLPLPEEVTDKEILIYCKTFKDALRLSLQKSGKSLKVLCIELTERGHHIEESVISLALSEHPAQKKNWPAEITDDFIELTTDIPRRYLALTC